MSERVWMRHSEHGGVQHFAVEAQEVFEGLGWQPCDAPPPVNPIPAPPPTPAAELSTQDVEAPAETEIEE